MPFAPRNNFLVATTLLLGALPMACEDTTTEPEGSDLRHIYFDGAEVAEALDEDPHTTFLVDLRVGNVVHFDQGDEPIDFSAFMAICPSMSAPVPMTSFMDMLELDFDDHEVWTMKSDLTETNEFRAMADGPGGCYWRCDANGKDCVEVCW